MLFIVLLIIPVQVIAGEYKEIWQCRDQFKTNVPTIVVAKISNDQKFGEIEVANTKYITAFLIEGFNRMWVWGITQEEKPQIKFDFVIKPNGDGTYRDFVSGDRQEMTCKQNK